MVFDTVHNIFFHGLSHKNSIRKVSVSDTGLVWYSVLCKGYECMYQPAYSAPGVHSNMVWYRGIMGNDIKFTQIYIIKTMHTYI